MDKRIERTRETVMTATIDLLGERGYAAFNIEAVAATSGVAKSTIYRHWPTKLALISEALESLNVQPAPPELSGSHHEQVCSLLGHLAEMLAESRFSACIPALIEAAEHHAEVSDFLHAYSARRRNSLVDLIQQGIAAGEFPARCDAEAASLALSGALFYCRVMTPEPFPRERIAALVKTVLGD